MNALKNKVQLIGNLGNDPEIKTFDGGKTKARFSMATSEVYKNDKGEKVTETQWHNIVAWNGTAKIVEKLLKKGNEVVVEGKLTSRSWDDKDGVKHYITEVVANEILLLKTKE
ncbi:MAG TPA: single-stranded DNA-binding protein [Bacteroidales bacterium]|nr:single-stranded DNA-binding protein [Bacteroidales bacterium]HRX95513.1 single-stranded DNA-binding protein [Bacteroidales bacterium]